MRRFRRGISAISIAALIASAPGLPCTQALAQVAAQATVPDVATPSQMGPLNTMPVSVSIIPHSLSQSLNGLGLGATWTGGRIHPALPVSLITQQPSATRRWTIDPAALPASSLVESSNQERGPPAEAPQVAPPQSDIPAIAVARESSASKGPTPGQKRLSRSALRRFMAGLATRLSNPFGSRHAVEAYPPAVPQPASEPALKPQLDPPPELPPGTPNSLAEVDLEPEPGRPYYPSPEDWSDEIIYSIIVDRFARSPEGRAWGDPRNGSTRHGGDLKGIISQLDYIKESGATAIHLSPITVNIPQAYHGYAPIHNLAIDPHMGTMRDFETLIAEAHQRGLRIILDIVINHVGPIFRYENEDNGGARWVGMDQPPNKIDHWSYTLGPSELSMEVHFTRHGVIDNWNDPDQTIYGDFPPDYRHYASDRPQTQKLLIDMVKFWLRKDVDGIRLDAIKHIHPSFTPRLIRELRAYVERINKKNFLFLGENSTGVDAEILPFMSGPDAINSAYNYPAYRRDNHALHGKAPTRVLEHSVNSTIKAFGSLAQKLVRFIDLHDTYRFLREGEPLGLLRVAFAFLMFSIGIPLVYYGTEQAFRQSHAILDPEGPSMPADPENRPDMFKEGQFKFPSSQGDKFDRTSETYRLLRKMADVRRTYPALRRGDEYVRWADPTGAGIFAFSRIYKNEEILVVLNTSPETRSAEMWLDGHLTPTRTSLADVFDPDYGTVTYSGPAGGSKATVKIPAYSMRVLVPRPAKKPANKRTR